MEHRIPPEEVKPGMYVRGFGGSWWDHPFFLSKFVVKPEHLPKIAQADIPYVIIDDSRGVGLRADQPEARDPVTVVLREASPRPRPAVRHDAPSYDQNRRDTDRERARGLVKSSLVTMRRTFGEVRLGRAVRLSEVTALVDEVVATVERSPRTLLEVLRLKKKDEYTYLHSVAVCTLMINLARHLGRDEDQVREYGLAGLLHDIGKMGIDDTILNKPGGLDESEFGQVRRHPEHGHEILLRTANVPRLALDVCLHHHERVDGKGYPHRLSGEALSEAARLGAICDVYDALTSDRAYKAAWQPVEAIAAMWRWEGQFDRRLLFAFMQSLGIFPPGLMVRLRSNRVGLVLENRRRNSRPRVLAFYAIREGVPIVPEEVTIADNFANDGIVAATSPEEWGLAAEDCTPEFILKGGFQRRQRAALAMQA